MGMHHTFAQAMGEGLLLAAFTITDTSGTPTITGILGPSFQSGDFAITDTGTGIYDVVISNFKGKNGAYTVNVNPVTTSLMACVSASSYTGNALAITIRVEDDASSLTDSSCFVTVHAW